MQNPLESHSAVAEEEEGHSMGCIGIYSRVQSVGVGGEYLVSIPVVQPHYGQNSQQIMWDEGWNWNIDIYLRH